MTGAELAAVAPGDTVYIKGNAYGRIHWRRAEAVRRAAGAHLRVRLADGGRVISVHKSRVRGGPNHGRI